MSASEKTALVAANAGQNRSSLSNYFEVRACGVSLLNIAPRSVQFSYLCQRADLGVGPSVVINRPDRQSMPRVRECASPDLSAQKVQQEK